MKARALVCDLFGTLIPKWPDEISIARKRQMARSSGVEERSFRDAWGKRWVDRELGRVSLEVCIAEVMESVGRPATPEVVARLSEVWRGPVAEHLRVPLRPEVVATLERARSIGLKIGLISNAGPEVPAIFQSGPLSGLIDIAVFSCTAGVAKPDGRIYLSACQALKVTAADCLYVGDGSDEELQGALDVGMNPILLRIESEIAKEGLPAGAAAWTGPTINAFDELWEHID